MTTIISELKKITSLPMTWAVVICTIIFSIIVSLVFESRFGNQGSTVEQDILKTVPDYIVIGFIALGAVLGGQEYQGGQIYTSISAVPRRSILITAKILLFSMVLYLVGLASMSVASAAIMENTTGDSVRIVCYSSIHLAVMGMFPALLTFLIRAVVPTLSVSLVLLVVAPAVLMPLTDWYEWLPSRASAELFLKNTISFDPVSAIVLASWIVGSGCAGIGRFIYDDS
ncbi:membrane protein [Actinomyces sp. Chiba101]|uniref:hypothetical protein n=1 Tax=Actinomyces TaxID=1654 RepID=UPI000974E49C|nr:MULTISPECIES: hypothetical protein [Actinomyces]BAW93782.1 membrane protein [Actinomyces sp. Chiba101]GAV93968.1 hypothetical protein ADENT20671_0733 [Actinomyces denticolens]